MIIKGTGGLGSLRTGGEHPKLQHYWERPEYWEESWRLEETCCHSNSSERPSVSADVKNSNNNNNNNNSINNNNNNNNNNNMVMETNDQSHNK